MKALVDLRPLRENRTVLRLWAGSTAAGFGGLCYVGSETRGAAAVGLAGLALPLIVLALAGRAFLLASATAGGVTAVAATALIAVTMPALRRFRVPESTARTEIDLHG